ncbi:hypothetical protein ACWKWC_02330 [Geodermatophilus nigrescens]
MSAAAELSAEDRRRRRELLRRHHPDVGGDPAVFDQIVRTFAPGGPPGADRLVFVRRQRGWARLRAWLTTRQRRRRRGRRVL